MSENPDNAQMKQAPRDKTGRFQPGASGNPAGRPTGSYGGFRAVLQMVVDVANQNQDVIRQALEEEARTNPARFARQFILPHVPRKDRQAFRERIRQMEAEAFEKASEGRP